MKILSHWFAPAVLAAAMGLGGFAPAPAQAQDAVTRVLVDIADVVLRSGVPYYRYGDYRDHDRLVVGRDRYGRVVYYRVMPNRYRADYRPRVVVRRGPPYGNAYGYYRNGPERVSCNRHGKCKARYYDPRHDRDRNRHDRPWPDRW